MRRGGPVDDALGRSARCSGRRLHERDRCGTRAREVIRRCVGSRTASTAARASSGLTPPPVTRRAVGTATCVRCGGPCCEGTRFRYRTPTLSTVRPAPGRVYDQAACRVHRARPHSDAKKNAEPFAMLHRLNISSEGLRHGANDRASRFSRVSRHDRPTQPTPTAADSTP
jgi:hypothetical protein